MMRSDTISDTGGGMFWSSRGGRWFGKGGGGFEIVCRSGSRTYRERIKCVISLAAVRGGQRLQSLEDEL